MCLLFWVQDLWTKPFWTTQNPKWHGACPESYILNFFDFKILVQWYGVSCTISSMMSWSFDVSWGKQNHIYTRYDSSWSMCNGLSWLHVFTFSNHAWGTRLPCDAHLQSCEAGHEFVKLHVQNHFVPWLSIKESTHTHTHTAWFLCVFAIFLQHKNMTVF